MSLNGSLAGLVAVTAGCANVDVIGSFIIGAIAGVLVCVAVYFVEDKLKVDDPVGAVAVHGCNGIWGTIAVGLFDYKDGLFYGGGVHHLLIQLLGILCIAGWTIITMDQKCRFPYLYFRFAWHLLCMTAQKSYVRKTEKN